MGVGLKMFLGYAESVRYLTPVAGAAPGFSGISIFVLPSFPVIPRAAAALGASRVAFGAQDGPGAGGCAHRVRLAGDAP